MIVLDENLLALRLDNPITAWYPGRVCFITDLRPGTGIKDEVIPRLLLQVNGATFVTKNVIDFWRQVPAHRCYGSGRVYTVTVGCTDASGNSPTKTTTVTMPHDQGKK